MTTQVADTTVTTSVVVEAPIERAFEVFTAEMSAWWSPDHHLIQGELAEMVVEPFAGGRIYDRSVDGSECCWPRVLAYERPTRFVFSWDVWPKWEIEPDPAKASEVEIRFVAQAPERTLVELEHRHLERHGDGWEGMRDAVRSPGGWPVGMERFAEAAAA
jgi:uncharacterized protein YndB with AHSA1/START domain